MVFKRKGKKEKKNVLINDSLQIIQKRREDEEGKSYAVVCGEGGRRRRKG